MKYKVCRIWHVCNLLSRRFYVSARGHRPVTCCISNVQPTSCLQTIAELIQEKEGVVSALNSPSSPQSASYSPSMQQQQVGAQQHLAVELADSKAKIRRLRQEL